ncbi:MAG: 3-keto-5-aminohexanoate cleavage protein [Burkholderiales bacterium]
MDKLIIEVRLNEHTMRTDNPQVPWSPDEIAADAAACRAAGASIVHFHVRGPAGEPALDFETYRDGVARVRAASDVLVAPTLGPYTPQASAADRFAFAEALARAGLAPDIGPIDMGSTNFGGINRATGWLTDEDGLYLNSHAMTRHFATRMKALGIKPQLLCWNLPMLRAATLYLRAGLVDAPGWLQLSLADASVAHHPATLRGLTALMDFLPTDLPLHWTLTVGGASVLPLAATAVALGGHVSVGLGDHPYPELDLPDNAGLVRRVVALAQGCGREVATPAEARQMLGMPARAG